MYTRKSNGPSTDPWGTPIFIKSSFELNPLIETIVFDWLNKI